jgi:hypothetical protein
MRNIFVSFCKTAWIFLLCQLILVPVLFAQTTAEAYVDNQGIMRWGESKKEVMGFGVNYTVPFAHAYRVAERLGMPHEKAIDEDVYHFARLGLDLYRVHVWDTEISDSVGNLLENEHLRLFDYTIHKMKERGIKFVITPIAYWGSGWPEPDEPTPGFSAKYGKGPSLTHPEAIKAQENYLYQFLNHQNPYTGLSYKEDPDVIAFEISNEPHHGGSSEEVTAFINRMVGSMRNTGTQKPIFYNMSHSTHLAEGYFNAGIQGGTFQWYPTNLVAGHELQGNFLPNVDQYTFPFGDHKDFQKMAKIVYEFDPADVGASYMYPAMARSFREAGLQLAAQFAYDATYMAPYNTEYGTHYMNLVYAPQKALSLKIASEVFHQLPLHKDFGSYPENKSFGDFRVDYEQDLAELVSQDKFFYTNHTSSRPPSPKKLEQIAGYGNSPLVKYEGKGAYFLDRLEKGVWRLEVMPDAIWVEDPFAKASLKKKATVLNWREWPMTLQLPDLGENFTLSPLNEGNNYTVQAVGDSFAIRPGTYLVTKEGSSTRWNGDSQWKNISLKEFVAPASTLDKSYLLHQPPSEARAGEPLQLNAEVVTAHEPQAVELHIPGRYPQVLIPMEKAAGYTYTATLPDSLMEEGFLHYFITVKEEEEEGISRSYPSGREGSPADWDFYDEDPYKLRIVAPASPVYLFNAITDADKLMWQWVSGSQFTLQPAQEPGKAAWVVNLGQVPEINPDSRDEGQTHDFSMRYYFKDKAAGRQQDLTTKKRLVVHGKSLHGKSLPLQLALVMQDGAAFGAIVNIDPEEGDYVLSLDELKKVKLVSLPRPYPGFLPYYFENKATHKLEMKSVESLQFSIGPGIPENELEAPQGIAIESVRLE